jgi:UPF0042 nucleotide-binding protein
LNKERPLVVIVTGLSGSGLSTALGAFEDSGFYCIDNLPVELLDQTLALIESGAYAFRGFAVGMDIRDQKFVSLFPNIQAKMEDRVNLETIFLTADEQTILARFGATRRKHPLLPFSGGSLAEAIRKEQQILSPIADVADVVLETSTWSPQALAAAIEARYQGKMIERNLHVTFCSFGFKHGLIRPADMVLDVRFLPNPYFDLNLRAKSGLEMAVSQSVLKSDAAIEFLNKSIDILRFLLPQYLAEGKHYFRVGIGCTGGFHRSVAVTEELASQLRVLNLPNIEIAVEHRDLLTSDA